MCLFIVRFSRLWHASLNSRPCHVHMVENCFWCNEICGHGSCHLIAFLCSVVCNLIVFYVLPWNHVYYIVCQVGLCLVNMGLRATFKLCFSSILDIVLEIF